MSRITQRLGFTRFEADEYYRKALVEFRKRHFSEAIHLMDSAIEVLPHNPEYYAARGYMFLEDAVHDKAEADFDHALKLYPHEMLAHYGRGMIAYSAHDYDAALQHFTAAYYANQERPETLYYLALTYFHKRDLASAANLMKLAHDHFEAANDKRKNDAARWLRELSKLAQKTAALLKQNPTPEA